MYRITITDRNNNKIVQIEERKNLQSADKLWCKCLKNVNTLQYKMKFEEIENRK
jgi:hypothetical protein